MPLRPYQSLSHVPLNLFLKHPFYSYPVVLFFVYQITLFQMISLQKFCMHILPHQNHPQLQ